MEIRQLQYFREVCQLQSFTQAAIKLHVSQPSITNAMQKLEQELKTQLLDRSQKKIVPTAEGRLFFDRVEKLLYDWEQTIAEIGDLNQLRKGNIRFGVPPMIGAYLFPNIFISFKKAYPELALTAAEEGTFATLAKLESGELDLGIIILPEASTTLEMLPITREEVVLCVAAGHQLAQERVVDFACLKNEQFILLKEEFYLRKLVLDQCARHHFTPQIIFSSSQVETIKAMVANNTGISFLMAIAAQGTPNVASISLATPISIVIGLAWKKDRYLSKATKKFIEYVREYKL